MLMDGHMENTPLYVLHNEILWIGEIFPNRDEFPPIKHMFNITEERLIYYKVIAAISLFISTILFGIIPYVLACFRKNKKPHILLDSILDVINAFSGGVLMSVGILHILGTFTTLNSSRFQSSDN
jgi:hypothetical protein